MKRRFAAIAFATMLLGCAQTGTEGVKMDAGKTLKISHEVWANYQDYVRRGRGLGPDRSGAFAVAVAGDYGLAGFGTWSYCPRMYDGCRPGGDANPIVKVLDFCRRESIDCLIFARSEDIQVSYEISD